MPGNNTFIKAMGMAVFIAILTGIILSTILLKEATIFSSWFIDVYKPSKGFVIEKAPIRLVFFGEANEKSSADNIVRIIEALEKTKYENYKFNENVNITFESSLKGDRQRDNNKEMSIKVEAGHEINNLLDKFTTKN